jgi:hypothetical protein
MSLVAIPHGSRTIMASRREPKRSRDFFPTPPWATRALMECALPHLGIDPCRLGNVWEPACGEGHMAEVLREYIGPLSPSDKYPYGYGATIDFLRPKPLICCNAHDWIITNPPFGEKTELFVTLALERAKVGVAMFVRLQWLETVGRYERIYSKLPPTLIAFFSERVNLCKGRWEPDGSTATAYIWLVWVRGKRPRAPFWIPPGCRQRLSRPDDVMRFTAHPVRARNGRLAA